MATSIPFIPYFGNTSTLNALGTNYGTILFNTENKSLTIDTNGSTRTYILKPIVNDLTTALATTEDNVPVSTKVVKELSETIPIVAGTTLWTNPNPSLAFPAQTVTLSEPIENFNYYEIEYAYDSSTFIGIKGKTSKISINDIPTMFFPASSSALNYRGLSSVPSGTSVGFSNEISGKNTTVIPYKIYGYKA